MAKMITGILRFLSYCCIFVMGVLIGSGGAEARTQPIYFFVFGVVAAAIARTIEECNR